VGKLTVVLKQCGTTIIESGIDAFKIDAEKKRVSVRDADGSVHTYSFKKASISYSVYHDMGDCIDSGVASALTEEASAKLADEYKKSYGRWMYDAVYSNPEVKASRKSEQVEFVWCERDRFIWRRPKITMRKTGKGDLYMTMCWEGESIGSPIMRIKKSGECSTRSPKVVKALFGLYDAIMEDAQ